MAKQRKTKKIKDVEVVEEKDVVEEEIEEIDEVEEELEEKPKKNKKEKNEEAAKEDGFFRGVRKEMNKVVWPKAGEVAKNTLAVLIFCLILIAFFTVVVLGVSYLKELFS
jgi:preprotein translocase subunit SecE